MTLPRGLRHRDPEMAGESDIFQSKPIQIRALLKAIGWSQFELGRFVGVYTRTQMKDGYKARTCMRVSKWTRGKVRPSKPHRQRMTQLVEMVRKDYLKILRGMIRDERLADK